MADNRIAYGLAKKYGIDTDGMSPKEVWEALAKKGVKELDGHKDEVYYKSTEELKEQQQKELSEKELEVKKSELSGADKYKSEISGDKSTAEFTSALIEAKENVAPKDAWRVSSPTAEAFDEEHPNAKKYVTKGGSTIAITPDGDIVGVCHNRDDAVSGSDMLAFAVNNGGKKLDAFSKLWRFYSKNGFEPVSWTPFNEQYAPPGWEKGRDEPEPIIFWKYTGKKTAYKDSADFMNSVKPSESYVKAKNFRDKELEV